MFQMIKKPSLGIKSIFMDIKGKHFWTLSKKEEETKQFFDKIQQGLAIVTCSSTQWHWKMYMRLHMRRICKKRTWRNNSEMHWGLEQGSAVAGNQQSLIPDGTIPHAHLGTPHFQSHLQLLRHRQNSKQKPRAAPLARATKNVKKLQNKTCESCRKA